MQTNYAVVINGYKQTTISFTCKEDCYRWIKELLIDGRLTRNDNVEILTTITITDKVIL